MHFPETSLALNRERLGVFGWEVEIFGPRHCSTKLFDQLLNPPEKNIKRVSENHKTRILGYMRKQQSLIK